MATPRAGTLDERRPHELAAEPAARSATALVALHMAVAVVLAGMPVALCLVRLAGYGSVGTPAADAAFAGCLLVSALLTAAAMANGVVQRRPTPQDFLAWVLCLSGVPGLFLPQPGQSEYQIAFALATLARFLILHWGIPRLALGRRVPIDRIVGFWLLTAATLVTLGSLAIAIRYGIGLGSSQRLHGATTNWLHANLLAAYACICVLGALAWMRGSVLWRIGMGSLGAYILLLSQSRTAMASLAVATLVWCALATLRNAPRAGLMALACGLGVLAGWPVLSGSVAEWGPVRGIVARTTVADPSGGRLEKFEQLLAIVDRSPMVGGGFKTVMAPVENGYVSLMIETGYLGLAIYLVFVALVLGKALALRVRAPDEAGRSLGEWVIVLTVFMLARSMGERSHALQIGDALSNAWLLYAGLLLVVRPVRASVCRAGFPRGRRHPAVAAEPPGAP